MSLQGVLAKVRVLDLAGEAAVFAGRLLADLGAEVILVEPPAGSAVRRRPPFLDDEAGRERSLHHLHYNRNKRSVVLDLTTEAGRTAFLRLAATADALLESAPGGLAALGLGYEAVATVNPGIVYSSVTPFPADGPVRDYRGNDLIGAASSGLLYLNGWPADPPYQPGGEQAYKMASLVAAAGTLMALVGRERDPARRGRRLDVSLQEVAAMATTQTGNANYYTWHGRVPGRAADQFSVFRCKDGKWLSFVIQAGVVDSYANVDAWLREEGIQTPFGTPAWEAETDRVVKRRLLGPGIAELCSRYDRAHVFHEGQRRGELVMPVNDVADLLADEQLAYRGFFASIDHPELGRTLVDGGSPYRFSGLSLTPSRRAPLLGEDTRAVLESASVATVRARSGAAAPTPDPTRLLAGVRVADFSWMIAGPATSRMLADFGAEVIKIESQHRVDNVRVTGAQPAVAPSIDTNGVFNDYNTNKLSLRLNLNHRRGQALAKELVRRSDLVLNNYRGDRMAKWGLGYEDLRQLRPDLIMAAMPVMGSTGPLRNYGAYGNGVIAFGGLNQLSGFPERPPAGLGPLYSDFSGPYFVVIALMAALHCRGRTGAGQFIDFSQVEGTASLLGPAILEYTANGRLPARPGNRALDYCPHGVYPCHGNDRWCAIAARADDEWAALSTAIDRPELASDPRFATFAARKANEDEVDAVISAWTGERDPWQVTNLLQGVGVMAAVVEDVEDMVTRDPWRHLTPVAGGRDGLVFTTHQQPLRIDGHLPTLRRAPLFGEHSERVLREVIGLSDQEIEELYLESVIF